MSYTETLFGLKSWLTFIIILTVIIGMFGSVLYFILNFKVYEVERQKVYDFSPLIVTVASFIISLFIIYKCTHFIDKIDEIVPQLDQQETNPISGPR